MGGDTNKNDPVKDFFTRLAGDFNAFGEGLKKDLTDITTVMQTGKLPGSFVRRKKQQDETKAREAETALAEAMKEDPTLVTLLSAHETNMLIAGHFARAHIERLYQAKAKGQTTPSTADLIRTIKDKDRENTSLATRLLETAKQNTKVADLLNPAKSNMAATAQQIALEHTNTNTLAELQGKKPFPPEGFIDKLIKEDTRRQDLARKMLAKSVGNKDVGQATLTNFVTKEGNMEKALRYTREYVDSVEEAKAKGNQPPAPTEYARKLAELMVDFDNDPASAPASPAGESKHAQATPRSSHHVTSTPKAKTKASASAHSNLTESASDGARRSQRHMRALEDAERKATEADVPPQNPSQTEHNTTAPKMVRIASHASLRSTTSQHQTDHLRLSGRHLGTPQQEKPLPEGFHTLSEAERIAWKNRQNKKDALQLARDTHGLNEAMQGASKLTRKQGEQLKTASKNVKDAIASTEDAAVHLNEAADHQQDTILIKLMIATIASGAVSLGCAGWLLQTLGSSGYLTLAAAIITTLAVAATATCGGLFAAKKKHANAEKTQDTTASATPPEAGK